MLINAAALPVLIDNRAMLFTHSAAQLQNDDNNVNR